MAFNLFLNSSFRDLTQSLDIAQTGQSTRQLNFIKDWRLVHSAEKRGRLVAVHLM
jgi:hypothetical protein